MKNKRQKIKDDKQTCIGLIPSPISSTLGSLALKACISPNMAVPVKPASTASSSKSYEIKTM